MSYWDSSWVHTRIRKREGEIAIADKKRAGTAIPHYYVYKVAQLTTQHLQHQLSRLQFNEETQQRKTNIQTIKDLRGVGSTLVEKKGLYKGWALAMMLSTAYCWYLDILPMYWWYSRCVFAPESGIDFYCNFLWKEREQLKSWEERSYGYNADTI